MGNHFETGFSVRIKTVDITSSWRPKFQYKSDEYGQLLIADCAKPPLELARELLDSPSFGVIARRHADAKLLASGGGESIQMLRSLVADDADAEEF